MVTKHSAKYKAVTRACHLPPELTANGPPSEGSWGGLITAEAAALGEMLAHRRLWRPQQQVTVP